MEQKRKYYSKWASPSNIAFIKYWGKYGNQYPQNPSLSLTLKNSLTEMSMEVLINDQNKSSLDFYFENLPNEKFKNKIEKILIQFSKDFPWLNSSKIIIYSKNTFPHSSGIASSASSMSALALNIVSIDLEINNQTLTEENFYKKVSFYARLASGSASRSVYGQFAIWGEVKNLNQLNDFSNDFALPWNDYSDNFKDFCDSIIIVDEKEKSVSSRAGHSLMDSHPFASKRYEIANSNLINLIKAMRENDKLNFIKIVEEEALMLHALMMTSHPSVILLKPKSLEIIEKIKEFRNKTNSFVCFTIDAGPNIHVLYPEIEKLKIREWLNNEFSNFNIIHDEMGHAPIKRD